MGIILGTGLGSLAGQIQTEATLEYERIPHFPRSTTVGHTGQLVCGRLQGLAVVAMEGRFHAYEGYTQQQITFPVRMMRALGGDAHGLERLRRHESAIRRGDIVVIEDHINLMNGNPLIGVNDDRLGPRSRTCRPLTTGRWWTEPWKSRGVRTSWPTKAFTSP